MTNNNKRKDVEALVDKAVKAERSEDALRYSQAACNAANAMRAAIETDYLKDQSETVVP